MSYTRPSGSTAVPGQRILSARYNTEMNAIAVALNARREATEIQPAEYGGTGVDGTDANGSVLFYNGVGTIANMALSVESFGASPSATASANTTAFNAAIVASGGTIPVLVPAGTWDLNALTKTEPFQMFGAGRATILRFNTTGVGIECEDLTPDQSKTFSLRNLAFTNVTNVPASFILNRGAINARLDRLYFDHCAATFCIDNESGYGLKVADCVFSDVTGSGIRLQYDGVGATKYSYDVTLLNNDFTRLSLDALTIDGTSNLNMLGGVIEACRYGLWTNYRVASQIASVQSWGINLQGVYFEGNATDIKCETSANYSSRIVMTACHMTGTPTIALGTHGRLVAVGMQLGGGNECTISGSSEARVTLVGHVNSGFIQSGIFQWNDLGQYYDIDSIPAWYSTGNPDVLNAVGSGGVIRSRWTRNGTLVTLSIFLVIGTDPTIAAGNFVFTDPFLTLLPALAFTDAAGSALLYDSNTGNKLPAVAYLNDATHVTLAGVTGDGAVTHAVPWTWAVGDQIRLTITYRSTAS